MLGVTMKEKKKMITLNKRNKLREIMELIKLDEWYERNYNTFCLYINIRGRISYKVILNEIEIDTYIEKLYT